MAEMPGGDVKQAYNKVFMPSTAENRPISHKKPCIHSVLPGPMPAPEAHANEKVAILVNEPGINDAKERLD